jgi:phage terminase small subunit
MPRGRKPTPTNVKLITGNPGKRPLPVSEPRPTPRRIGPPKHLNADAQVEWARICEELHALGLLTGLDRVALAAYCQAYGRWAQAERALGKITNQADGLIIRTQSGNMIQNPLWWAWPTMPWPTWYAMPPSSA